MRLLCFVDRVGNLKEGGSIRGVPSECALKMSHENDALDWVDELQAEQDREAMIHQYNQSSQSSHAAASAESPVDEQHEKDTRHVIASAAYLFFLIPLITNRRDSYYRFHAKQGLKVNILEALVLFVKPILLTLGAALNSVLIISITTIVSFMLWVLVLVFILLGIYNAWTEKKSELPLPDLSTLTRRE